MSRDEEEKMASVSFRLKGADKSTSCLEAEVFTALLLNVSQQEKTRELTGEMNV